MKKLLAILILCIAAFALMTRKAYACRKMTVQQGMDLVKVFAGRDTKFVIKEDIDLGGKTVKIGKGCTLVFNGGSFQNGVLIGDGTRMSDTRANVFHNCEIQGKWLNNCSYSTMFDIELEAVKLLKNMSCLSPVLKLSANRSYQINANEVLINAEVLEAVDRDKPLLSFHTTDPNVSGIKIAGETVTIRNIMVRDDYTEGNDDIFGPNKLTMGNTIAVCSPNGCVSSLVIEGCHFFGGTSSSFVASSQVKNCVVKKCSFSGYMADHGIYCSKTVESFIVNNCDIQDVIHTKGVFKVRSSNNLKLFSITNINALNLDGYLAVLSALKTPEADVLFSHINVRRIGKKSSVFYGVCLSDETNETAEDGYNINRVLISDCSFGYGYDGNPIIYPGSGRSIKAKEIKYDRVQAFGSNFGGGKADKLVVINCEFYDLCRNTGIYIYAYDFTIMDTKLESTINSKRLFLLNDGDKKTHNVRMKNVVAAVNSTKIFDVKGGDEIRLSIDNCRIASRSKTVVNKLEECSIIYKSSKTTFEDLTILNMGK